MQSVVERSVHLAAERLAWLGVAVILSLGSAGLVGAIGGPPGSGARPELTWTGDVAAEPGLAAAADELGALGEDVEQLGLLGRGALAALVARDSETLSKAIADGRSVLGEIETGTTDLRGRLAGMPGFGPAAELRIGPQLRQRYDLIRESLAATADLERSWVRLTGGAISATSLTTLLADHDTFAAEAAKLGSGARYAAALEQLEKATASLAEARRLRDEIANTSDVGVLDQWLERNEALDAALTTLYGELRGSRGRVTKAVREAFADVKRAQENLPPDTRGLVVIMADLARGGLNQAVIAIEEARGRLEAAIAAVQAVESSGP